MSATINYIAHPTLERFHNSRARHKGIKGPFGSGKSSGMCAEVWQNALNQEPGPDGVRQIRVGVFRNCFDDQTEILTEIRGWRLFRDLLSTDRVASLVGEELEFALPSMHYAAPYKGEMIGFEGEGVDFLVTPEHKLYVSRRFSRKRVWLPYEFITAEKAYGNRYLRVKREASWVGVDSGYPPEFFEWLGFWFAEGTAGLYRSADGYTRYHCVVEQKYNLEYVRALFDAAELPYTERLRPDGMSTFRLIVTEHTRPIIAELATFGKALTKWIPQWVKDSPPLCLQAFLTGYIAGDGGHDARGMADAYTSSSQLAGDLQELALRAGWVANLRVDAKPNSARSFASNGPSYRVTFVKPSKYHPILVKQVGRYRGWYKQPYDGMVYCLEVPSHVVYVRRGGVAHWSSQTYPMLKSTTIKTWLEWFPDYSGDGKEVFGPIKYDLPHVHNIRFVDPHRGPIHIEALFVALDQLKDIGKLKSFELTMAWINEASEFSKEAFDVICGRIDRFPKMKDGGVGATYPEVIMDYNPPAPDQWLYRLAEEETPEGYEFFAQPPAVFPDPMGEIHSEEGNRYTINPSAENMRWVAKNGSAYYVGYLQGKSDAFIRIYGMGEYGYLTEGRLVYTAYNDAIHYSRGELPVYPNLPLVLGFDFGLNPACVFGQFTPRGQLRIIDELYGEGLGVERFAEEIVKPHLAMYYRGMEVYGWGDPAGVGRGGQTAKTDYDMMTLAKLPGIRPSPIGSNEFRLRKQAVDHFLSRMVGGQPALVIGPKCRMLHGGFLGRYRLARQQVPGERDVFKEVPVKNRYSHVADALQYLCSGLVEPVGSREQDEALTKMLRLRNSYRPMDQVSGY